MKFHPTHRTYTSPAGAKAAAKRFFAKNGGVISFRGFTYKWTMNDVAIFDINDEEDLWAYCIELGALDSAPAPEMPEGLKQALSDAFFRASEKAFELECRRADAAGLAGSGFRPR